MTCEDLRRVSDLGREAILSSVQSSGDPDIDNSLFEATMKEVDKGFIEGPIDKHDLPVGSTLTKRFPVKQKNEVRPIDDYKASLVNFAVTQTEGVTVHTIDHIAALVAWWMKSSSLGWTCSQVLGFVRRLQASTSVRSGFRAKIFVYMIHGPQVRRSLWLQSQPSSESRRPCGK